MAKYQFKGLDEYAQYLQKIGKNTPEILGAGVYAMADIVADKVRQNITALPAVNDVENMKAYKQNDKSHLSIKQKKGLLDGFGISPMQNDNGYLNVKLGFDGYNAVQTKTYPKGQPNALIARVVESGSSYMDKTPFIRPAVSATQKEAVEKCKEEIDTKIKSLD